MGHTANNVLSAGPASATTGSENFGIPVDSNYWADSFQTLSLYIIKYALISHAVKFPNFSTYAT